MLTPQEVSGKGFPRSSFGSGGYQMSAVDNFLDTLTEDYTALFKENATLKAKLKVLAERVEEYRATEDAMRSTLLAAQKMASKMVQEAQEEKDQLLSQAKKEAAGQIAELDRQVADAKERLVLAQKGLQDFIDNARAICAKQNAFLDTLPELPLAKEPIAAPEEVAAPEAEDAAAEDAGEPAQPEQEAETTEPEQTPDAAVSGDTTVLPDDFKLSLEQLKFGRNYNKDE